MTRIGVRELRQHASRHLARVKAGETVEVTERGRLVALLVPPGPATTVRMRLIAAGAMVPASVPFRSPRRHAVAPGAVTSAEALERERADR